MKTPRVPPRVTFSPDVVEAYDFGCAAGPSGDSNMPRSCRTDDRPLFGLHRHEHTVCQAIDYVDEFAALRSATALRGAVLPTCEPPLKVQSNHPGLKSILKTRRHSEQDAAFPAWKTFPFCTTCGDHPCSCAIPHHALEPTPFGVLLSQVGRDSLVHTLQPQSTLAPGTIFAPTEACSLPLNEEHDALVLMQSSHTRSRSRSRHDSHEEDDESDPEARSSDDPPSEDDVPTITWTVITRNDHGGRVDIPITQDRPTFAQVALALFADANTITGVYPIQHLHNVFDDHLAIVTTTEDTQPQQREVIVYSEVICLHEQPVGGIPRLPLIRYMIWTSQRVSTRSNFVV